MKKQLPLFKWTPTEWDVLYALHGHKWNLDEALLFLKILGHKMTKKSMMIEIHEIRKKMYQYSKHMGSQNYEEWLEKNKKILLHPPKEQEDWKKKFNEMTEIATDCSKKSFEWKQKYEALEIKHEDCKKEAVTRVKALEKQCKDADEIIQEKRGRIEEAEKKNIHQIFVHARELAHYKYENQNLKDENLIAKFKGAAYGILLSAAIVYALLVLGVIRV